MKKQIEYLQRLFYDTWNDFGAVYLLVKYSDRTVIGKRGFTDEEKKSGLVLVFNDKTSNKLEWDNEGNISCELAFGARRENVLIHHDDLFGVFSPEAGIQFIRTGAGEEAPGPAPEKTSSEPGESSQVVSLSNFRKKRPRVPG